MTDWRIYYGNGETFADEDGVPSGEQARNIQAIVQSDKRVGWHIQHSADYYIWRDGAWLGVDIFGLFDFLLDSGLVLFGRTIGNDEYQEVFRRAKAEMDTNKTAFRHGERQP